MNRRWMALALAAAALAGCVVPGSNRKVRGLIRDLARKELGPAQRYEVSVSNESYSALKRGELSRVEVDGYDVEVKGKYTIDELIIVATDIRFDRKAGRIVSAGSTKVTARLYTRSIIKLLTDDGTLKSPTVEVMEGDIVRVIGRYEAFGLSVPVEAVGRLEVEPPAALHFRTTRIKSLGVPFPLKLSRSIDFQEFYKPILLYDVETAPGRVKLTGTIDWSKVGGGDEP